MTDPAGIDPLAAGNVVRGVVVAHHPWGLDFRLHELDEVATVDIRFVSDDPADMNEDRFPALGLETRAVVQGRMPSGQLRVSIRKSDLARVADTD